MNYGTGLVQTVLICFSLFLITEPIASAAGAEDSSGGLCLPQNPQMVQVPAPLPPIAVGGNSTSAAPSIPKGASATSGNNDLLKLGGAIAAAVIAGFFGLWGLRANRRLEQQRLETTRTLEQQKLEATRALEQQKLEAARILEEQKHEWEIEKARQARAFELQKRSMEDVKRTLDRQRAAIEITDQKPADQRLPASDAEEAERRYRERLIAALSNLKILDMPSPLRLENIYVQLRVREDTIVRYVRPEEISSLIESERSGLLHGSHARGSDRPAIAMAPEAALVKFRRIAILGDPGAGKTTLMRHLALRAARWELVGLPRLPVYVELRHFIDSGLRDLLDFAAYECDQQYGLPNARQYLEQQLDAGAVLLLLDGLDEVFGGTSGSEAEAAYAQVVDEVNRLAARFSNSPIAVTCRRAGWRGGLAAFQTLETLDFEWGQIEEFVQHWFAEDPVRADGLRRALEANVRIQMLAANPLLLSLIAIVYGRDLDLPERRAELYNRCVEVLLREWDAHRGIKRFSQFTADRKRDLLLEIAWRFHCSGQRYFRELDLLQTVEDYLPSINIPSAASKSIISEIVAEYGLLKIQAHGWYGFLHLTLQEYFAAVACNEKGLSAVRDVVARRDDPWWEEVILLLAGRMVDATPLFLGMFGVSVGTIVNDKIFQKLDESDSDDLFHSDLILGLRCLAGTPRITLAGLREWIVARGIKAFREARSWFDRDRIARALVEIGDREVYSILFRTLTASDADQLQAVSVARAIGSAGDREATDRLIELLHEHLRSPLPHPVIAEVVEALSNLRARSSVSLVLRILKDLVKLRPDDGQDQFQIDFLQTTIINALSRIADKTIISDLMNLLGEVSDLWAKQAIIKTIGSLGDESTAPEILEMLLTEPNSLSVDTAEALRNLKSYRTVDQILEQIRNPGNDWKIRWLLTDVLENFQEVAESGVIALLNDASLGKEVQIGLATTLAA
jgi:HEAT repeat protein